MALCTLLLENMEFKAYHGCYELEKVVGNRFLVSLKVEAETGDAAQRDDIAGTVNYLELYQTVKEQMAQTSDILENVAYRILHSVKDGFKGVVSAEVTVSKLAPPLGGKIEKVSVTMSL